MSEVIVYSEYDIGWHSQPNSGARPNTYSANVGYTDRISYMHDVPVPKDVMHRVTDYHEWQDREEQKSMVSKP